MRASRAVDLIRRKRDGEELTGREIDFLVEGIARGSIPDYQAAAVLMAVYLRGMTAGETLHLTLALARSGDQVPAGALLPPVMDKHSTGGVGDKTTLVVAPLLAAAGARVIKMSGRGLGHTGGTTDKLEAIPGFRTTFTPAELAALVSETGLGLAAASERLVPADGRLYAIRDVTATVDSPPLIASSIMAKKLATGAQTIVLDVKFGSGSLVGGRQEARRLAEAMLAIGAGCGRRVGAVLSDMDQPLGWAVGNALEVEEAIGCLKGAGPADLEELSLELASLALCLAGLETSAAAARDRLSALLHSGQALASFTSMVQAQGGPPGLTGSPGLYLPRAPVSASVTAPRQGWVARLDARGVGEVAALLGAGRLAHDQRVDPAVGVVLAVKVGDRVEAGDVLATVHARSAGQVAPATARLAQAFTFSDRPVTPPPLVVEVLSGE
ncbi:MAG: thymidine phosphorylase [bacterium]|nr:thymidine phosphorylase [bacterium]